METSGLFHSNYSSDTYEMVPEYSPKCGPVSSSKNYLQNDHKDKFHIYLSVEAGRPQDLSRPVSECSPIRLADSNSIR